MLVGFGNNLTVLTDWNILSDLQVGEGVATSGSVEHVVTGVRYIAPVLYPRTLRAEGESVMLNQEGTFSTVSMPTESSNYMWVTFEGAFHPEAEATYSNGTSVFPCVTAADPTIVDGPEGIIDYRQVYCRTATGEAPGYYVFTVRVGGQQAVGQDQLFFPDIPVLDSISGCPSDEKIHETYDCPTIGGANITITGLYFVSEMVSAYRLVTRFLKYICDL